LILISANMDIGQGHCPEPQLETDRAQGLELLEEGVFKRPESLGGVLDEAEGAASNPPVCGLPHFVVVFCC
jgi:hypothetical protein